ncbi:MAG: cupin domain-containing protein [Steroidobacteraceae bacterium]
MTHRCIRSAVAVLVTGLCLIASGAARADSGTLVRQLITEELADLPGKELTMITVAYPPGGSSRPHRHDAYVLVYVLEGTVQMQVAGGPLRTLKAGESFLERPNDIHVVSRNASTTRAAKLLVVALKAAGAPLSREVAPRAPGAAQVPDPLRQP